MKTIQQQFSVPFSYPVHFTHGAFDCANAVLASTLAPLVDDAPARIMVVVDQGVAIAHPQLLAQIEAYFTHFSAHMKWVAPPFVVPGGEQAKNGWTMVRDLMTRMGAAHLDRQSYVLAIGGGCVLDMVGFAASLVHRGVRLIRMPSTVLAQCDAGVGVKNGMNEGGAKNFVGTFAPPYAVINDMTLLTTLAPSDWAGGLAEAFKVAIIADAAFFARLCAVAPALAQRDCATMEEVVYQTAALHLRHIATSGDPFEFGSARPLDFGHWAAHRLELMSHFALGHGPAVAIGIALDSTYAHLKGLLSEAECAAILTGLSQCGLPIWSPLLQQRTAEGQLEILHGLEQFREHLGGQLNITLPASIGAKVEVHAMEDACVERACARLQSRIV